MKYLLTFLTLCLGLFLEAQPAILKGEVSDLNSGEAIAGASIKLGSRQAITNQRGRYEINTEAQKPLIISAVGYKTDTISSTNLQPFLQVTLQPIAGQLEEVVVSGNMRAVYRTESAIPVEVYNAKFFSKNPTPGVFEALSTLNGVQPQLNCNICNTGDIHINGMEGPYTMVLIDGMPIVSSLSRIYGFSSIPTSLIKRMEIVKGPASTLYGSDAVAGLINIITKDAWSAGKLTADVSATTLGELNADFSTGIRLKKANGLLGVNLFNYWTKQDINNDNFTDITQQRRISIFNKWDIERKNKLPMGLSIRYLAENRWGGELQWTEAYRGSGEIYGESILTNRFELTGMYGLTGGKRKTTLDYTYSFHDQESYYGTTIFNARQHLGFAQLRGELPAGKHQLLWGIPVKYTWYDDNTVITEKQGENAALKQVTVAGFLQDEWKINNKFLLLSGLRYEYNNTSGNVLAPRVALKWQPAPNKTLRLSGGNGFRVVNLFTEDHAALTGAREVVIANDLEPERSWNANLNYEHQWMGKKAFYAIDGSLFYTYFNNKIVADYDTDPTQIIYDNLSGYAISRGASMNLDITFKKGPKITGGFTLMDVFLKEPGVDGELEKVRQMFAPVFSANYAVSYKLRKWNTSFDLTGKTYGPQRLPVVPNDFRPAYAPWFSIVNLQVAKKINSSWEIYAAAKNLLNFIPRDPILHPDDPFDTPGGKYFNTDGSPRADTNPYGYTFDPTYSYAPMQGIKGMVGVRVNL